MRQIAKPGHPLADQLRIAHRIAGDVQAFIGFDAGQHQAGMRGDRPRQSECLLIVSTAGAPAGNTELDQQLEPRAALCAAHKKVELRHRIDQGDESNAWMCAGESAPAPDIGNRRDLIGHQHPQGTGFNRDPSLMDIGHRDAPGAGAQLLVKELWREAGLAVRTQAHTRLGDETRKPLGVVRQGRFAQYGHRHRQIAAQQLQIGRTRLLDREGRSLRRKALEAGVERLGKNLSDGRHAGDYPAACSRSAQGTGRDRPQSCASASDRSAPTVMKSVSSASAEAPLRV